MLTTGLCGCESLGVVIAISGLSASVQADLQACLHIISNTLVRLCSNGGPGTKCCSARAGSRADSLD